MMSIIDIVSTPTWNVIQIIALLIPVLELNVLIHAFRAKPPKKALVLTFLAFIADYLLFSVALNTTMCLRKDFIDYDCSSLELSLINAPWLCYAAVELVLVICLVVSMRAAFRYTETHLTQESIRETVNLLPMAICISDPDGTVLLANLKMNELSKDLFGSLLTDAEIFWNKITKTYAVHDGAYTVATSGGQVWLFDKDQIWDDDRVYDQIMAYDITEQYHITDELSQKNKLLKDVQLRMKSVSAKELSLVAAREIMNARMTVHNQMGSVLLTGKYYLDHPESMNEAELLKLLEYNNNFLMMEAEEPDDMPDEIGVAVRMARRIGVRVEITGDLPSSKDARSLIAQAIDQCASNAVRHADADLLEVVVEAINPAIAFPAVANAVPSGGIPGGGCTVSFTNNGIPPTAPIKETGGLSTLRKAVEAAAGEMVVESSPQFKLIIRLKANPTDK